MKVIKQFSMLKGTQIKTEFDDGSYMVQYFDAKLPTSYRSAPNNGMRRSLYPNTATKKCALMDTLAAAGIH